jgi:hypothetical protein
MDKGCTIVTKLQCGSSLWNLNKTQGRFILVFSFLYLVVFYFLFTSRNSYMATIYAVFLWLSNYAVCGRESNPYSIYTRNLNAPNGHDIQKGCLVHFTVTTEKRSEIQRPQPPWGKVLQKLTVAHLVRKFCEASVSLQYPHEPASGPYSEPDTRIQSIAREPPPLFNIVTCMSTASVV